LVQRLVSVRLFYDFLVEEGLRESNPVGRGRYTPGRHFGAASRPLVTRMVKLPWIPAEAEWLQLLEMFRAEPIRNRLMLALAYDSALRREELCSLRTDDVDPAHRTLRVRAETTKPAGNGPCPTPRRPVCCWRSTCGTAARSAGPGARCSCRSPGATTPSR
jgi:integrase/recombinase XerD